MSDHCAVCGGEVRLYRWTINQREVSGWRHPAPPADVGPHLAVLGTPVVLTKREPPTPKVDLSEHLGHEPVSVLDLPASGQSMAKLAKANGWSCTVVQARNVTARGPVETTLFALFDRDGHRLIGVWRSRDDKPFSFVNAGCRTQLFTLSHQDIKVLLGLDREENCMNCGFHLLAHGGHEFDRCPVPA